MLDTGQKLATAIDELTKLSTGQPATLEDLVALSAARDCIDELFRACTDELRNDPRVAPMWEAIAVATKLQPQRSPGRQKSAIYQPEDHVELFWTTFAGRFTWDFLPVDFLHALYIQWLSEQHPRVVALSKYTLTRRLKCAAAKSGDWFHTRARPGTLMKASEPLTARVPHWGHDGACAAIYGLRRSGV